MTTGRLNHVLERQSIPSRFFRTYDVSLTGNLTRKAFDRSGHLINLANAQYLWMSERLYTRHDDAHLNTTTP